MEPKKYRRCCGIDVHKKSVTVFILPPEGKRDVEIRKRNFRTFTRDLEQLRTWLKNCKVTESAMESRGQYWWPLESAGESIREAPASESAAYQGTDGTQDRSEIRVMDCRLARNRPAQQELGAAARDPRVPDGESEPDRPVVRDGQDQVVLGDH